MRKNLCTLLTVTCLLLLTVFGVSRLSAQTSGGTIAGSVFDPSGALVPNATITATGENTGTIYKAESSSAGVFRFSQMQLGRYNLTVTAAGFNTLSSPASL